MKAVSGEYQRYKGAAESTMTLQTEIIANQSLVIEEKRILIEDIIKWNESTYNHTWHMNYQQTAQATRNSLYAIIVITVADFILAIAVWYVTERTACKWWIRFLAAIILLTACTFLYYMAGQMNLWAKFQNPFGFN